MSAARQLPPSSALLVAVRTMPSEMRDRVLERACILHFEAGYDWPEADRKALEQEGDQPGLRGVA